MKVMQSPESQRTVLHYDRNNPEAMAKRREDSRKADELVKIIQEKQLESFKESDFPGYNYNSIWMASRKLGYSDRDERDKKVGTEIKVLKPVLDEDGGKKRGIDGKIIMGEFPKMVSLFTLTDEGKIKLLRRKNADLELENSTLKAKVKVLQGNIEKTRERGSVVAQDSRSRKGQGDSKAKSTHKEEK